MQQDLTIASHYLPALAKGDTQALLGSPALEVAREGSLRVAYAPFDYVALSARLVVVGITPGESQALVAIRAAQAALAHGTALADVLHAAKLTASFSGSAMRSNLVTMLDQVGVARLLGLRSSAELFTPGCELVHFTSALRYPVFMAGKNYNGAPDMIRTPLLRRMVETHLAEEARLLPGALWLPLGPKPAQALRHLAGMGLLDPTRILDGLPHPSPANNGPVGVFIGRTPPEASSPRNKATKHLSAKARLIEQVARLMGEAA